MIFCDCVSVAQGASKKEVEQHLEMGKKLLGAGQLADALSHYHAAVGKSDGNNKVKSLSRKIQGLKLNVFFS